MATQPTTPNPPSHALVGTWIRAEPAPPCASKYAAQLVIGPGGLYNGQASTPGEFTWWDAGTWRVKAPGVLALSVANDEVIEYRFELRGNHLSITDPGGCRSEYRRTP